MRNFTGSFTKYRKLFSSQETLMWEHSVETEDWETAKQELMAKFEADMKIGFYHDAKFYADQDVADVSASPAHSNQDWFRLEFEAIGPRPWGNSNWERDDLAEYGVLWFTSKES